MTHCVECDIKLYRLLRNARYKSDDRDVEMLPCLLTDYFGCGCSIQSIVNKWRFLRNMICLMLKIVFRGYHGAL